MSEQQCSFRSVVEACGEGDDLAAPKCNQVEMKG